MRAEWPGVNDGSMMGKPTWDIAEELKAVDGYWPPSVDDGEEEVSSFKTIYSS